MSAKAGALVLIKVGDGGGPETFTTIGGLRTSHFRLNQEAMDASHLESGLWRQLNAGTSIISVMISGSGIFTDSAAEETVRGYAFAGNLNNYKFIFANGNNITGAFKITQYERSGDYDGEETYSLTLESAGAITFATS